MSLISYLKAAYKNPSVKSVGMYTFSNFFSKAVSFLLLFVFTNPVYITPSENGLISLFSTSLVFLMPFMSMAVIHSTSTDFFKLDAGEFRNFFTTGFIIPVVVTVLSTIVLFFLKDYLQQTFGFPAMFVWMIPVVSFFIFCNEQLLSLARNNNEPSVYLKANISKTIFEFGISFVLVVFFAYRWLGRLEGILIAYALVSVYGFYYFKKKNYLFGKIEKKYLYSELVYAVPIIALQANIFAMNSSDKFFLAAFTNDNNATVGVYSIAYVFASMINIFAMAILQYIFPRIYTMLSSGNVDYVQIRKFFLGFTAIMTVALVGMIVATPVLYHFFINEKYHPALQYCWLLCGGCYLWAITYFLYAYLLFYKKKRTIFILSIAGIIVSVTLNYLLIPKWKDMGAAWSTFLSYLLVLIITLFFTGEFWKKFLVKPTAIPPESEQ